MRRWRLGGLWRSCHGLLDGVELGLASIANSVTSQLPHFPHLYGRP
jgi:hypothetical protein